MSQNLEFIYALIDTSTGLCLAVCTSSSPFVGDEFVLIPHLDESYEGKYYNMSDECWYYDAEFTQPFDPEA